MRSALRDSRADYPVEYEDIIMKRILSVLLSLSILMACGAAPAEETAPAASVTADVMPIPLDPEPDLENGSFSVNVEDLDHVKNGWVTLALYKTDHYNREQVESLVPGQTILVNGEVYTVASDVEARDESWFEDEESLVWDIETEEECWDGIRFQTNGTETLTAYVGDWIPVTFVGRVRVSLPASEGFKFVVYPGGEEPETFGADEFIRRLREDWSVYNQYNSDAVLEDGKLTYMSVSGYPHGPSTGEEMDEDYC